MWGPDEKRRGGRERETEGGREAEREKGEFGGKFLALFFFFFSSAKSFPSFLVWQAPAKKGAPCLVAWVPEGGL